MVKKKQENNKTNLIIIGVISALLLIAVINLIINAIGDTSPRQGATSANAIVIPITGEISSQGVAQGFFSQSPGSAEIVNRIKQADQDSSVQAIYFEINSPGGAPVASHEIVKAIANTEKPTISLIRETGASGAYWIASATDHIVSDELSITGSVGVQGSYIGLYGLMEQFNVTYERLAGGEYKDLATPLREMQDKERELLEEKIDLMHEYFKNDVQQKRNLTDEQMGSVGTGAFFIGLEAFENGLIDSLGGEDEAKENLAQMLNVTEINLVRQERSQSFFQTLAGINMNAINPFSATSYSNANLELIKR